MISEVDLPLLSESLGPAIVEQKQNPLQQPWDVTSFCGQNFKWYHSDSFGNTFPEETLLVVDIGTMQKRFACFFVLCIKENESIPDES